MTLGRAEHLQIFHTMATKMLPGLPAADEIWQPVANPDDPATTRNDKSVNYATATKGPNLCDNN
jgi:hypothetical protein